MSHRRDRILNGWDTMLYRFMSGDFPITITILAILAYWAANHRSTVRELWHDERPVWSWLGRGAIALAVLAPLWIAVFDNWRDLLGYALSPHDRWMSNPFATTPAPAAVHWVTFGLIGVSVLVDALLYAKRRNGLWLPVMMIVFGGGYFYFMNSIRMRVDALLLQAENSLQHPELLGFAFTLFWSLGLYIFIVSTIIAIYLVFFGAAALVLSLLYGLTSRGGHPAPESLPILHRPSTVTGRRERE